MYSCDVKSEFSAAICCSRNIKSLINVEHSCA